MKAWKIHALLLLLTAAPSFGQQCGDCDHNGRVTIAEIVRVVHAALEPDLQVACGLGCAGPCYDRLPTDPPCPCPAGTVCEEFVDGCQASFCVSDNNVEFYACPAMIAEAGYCGGRP